MLVKRSLTAGLVTGTMTAVLIMLFFFSWEQFRQVWPVVFVPVFVTGVCATRRAGRAIAGARDAALAGAVAGLAAAAVTLPAAALTLILVPVIEQTRTVPNILALHPVLLDRPFLLPPTTVFLQLAAPLPFPLGSDAITPDGVRVSRIPWTLPLFLPIGTLLSALQSWLYHALGRRAKVGLRAVGWIAKLRSSFQNKLLLGFSILSVMIFVVGWLSFSVIEAMHAQLHVGRVRQHWLDHTTQVQADLRTQSDAIAQLATNPSEATLQEVSALGQKIAAQLAHLKAFPPPAHPVSAFGVVNREIVKAEAERRLPLALEADSRFGDVNKAVARVLDLYGSGNSAEAQAAVLSMASQQRAVNSSLQQLAAELDADQVSWIADADGGSHGQLIVTMLLILLATGVAFPLGYVFSQVVVRPVNQVSQGLERIGSGDFASRVEVENRDELGELAQRVNSMSVELDRLYRELEDKRQQVEAASEHKSAFLANMSHELRTPLNAIIGFSEVLLERMFGDLTDKQEEYLRDILASGRHQLALVNDILDLSKVEAGQMELEPGTFSLPEALESGLTMLKERASRHGIALSLEVDPAVGLVEADERKVKQVVFNLLSNAVKFTPDGGRVELSARSSDGEVRVEVRDTGAGIALEDQERIFEEFRRVGQGSAKTEGTGLGLSLAKKFVELHGGRIWVESKPGAGSTFTFALPLRLSERGDSLGAPNPASASI